MAPKIDIDTSSIDDPFVAQIMKFLCTTESWGEKTTINNGYARNVICPQCGKDEAYLYHKEPLIIRCNRKNNCGGEASLQELYPEDYAKIERECRPSSFKNTQKISHYKLGIPSAIYEYKDIDGKILLYSCRFNLSDGGKEFRLCHADEKDERKWSIKGIELVPYNLPELNENPIVFIVEGEKDVETLRSLGVVATCNPMGAGKWKKEFNKYFEGRKIIILRDNDSAGRRHGLDVANHLDEVAKAIKIIDLPDLPDKGDISDWIELGHSKKELFDIIKKTNHFTGKKWAKGYTASELVKMDLSEPRWAVRGIIPEGLSILGGKPKCGKSILAMNICLEIALGGKVLNEIDVEKRNVLCLALEDTPMRLQDRVIAMLKGRKSPDSLIIFNSWPLMDQGGYEKLEEEMTKISDLGLVVIDTFQKIRPRTQGKNTNIYETDYKHIGELKEIADRHGIAILLIHHMRKTKGESVMDDFSGSFGLTGAADCLLALVRKSGQNDADLHITGRDVEEVSYAMRLEPQEMLWKKIGKSQEVRATKEQQIICDTLKNSDKPLSPKDIARVTGLKDPYIRNTLGKLVKDEHIKKVDYGKYIYNENH